MSSADVIMKRKEVHTVSFGDDAEFYQSMNFKVMKNLRSLEERIQMLAATIATSTQVVDTLKQVNCALRNDKHCEDFECDLILNAFNSIQQRLIGYQKAAETLLSRTRGVSTLVSLSASRWRRQKPR